MVKFLQDERGTATVIFAICFVALIGFLGLVVDVGNLSLQKAKIQNALDAACLAGAQELPDTVKAQDTAIEYAELNGLNESEVTLQVNSSIISADATRTIKLYFIPVFGFNTSSVNVSAAASGSMAHVFDYTLFSGSTRNTLTLNGNHLYVGGTAHTNQNFKVNGNYISVTGACEAVGTISSNGNNINLPYLYPHSAYVDMLDYTTQVREQAQAAGHVYNSSQTYNGNNIYVDNSIYIKGNATLNGNRIYGAGAILTTGDITLNGNCLSATTNDQVCLYSGEDITINGNNITIHGILYAPNGDITFNGNNITVYGKVIGYKANFNGNDITINGTDSNVISLPNHGARLVR